MGLGPWYLGKALFGMAPSLLPQNSDANGCVALLGRKTWRIYMVHDQGKGALDAVPLEDLLASMAKRGVDNVSLVQSAVCRTAHFLRAKGEPGAETVLASRDGWCREPFFSAANSLLADATTPEGFAMSFGVACPTIAGAMVDSLQAVGQCAIGPNGSFTLTLEGEVVKMKSNPLEKKEAQR